jgi:Clr5 domain
LTVFLPDCLGLHDNLTSRHCPVIPVLVLFAILLASTHRPKLWRFSHLYRNDTAPLLQILHRGYRQNPEMETYQFEPGEHNEQNQAEMENISENTEQASLPDTLSVAALEYESRLGPSDWALEMPPTDTWFPDRDPSFLGPLDMAHSISSVNTRNSVKLTSDASVIVPYSLFQYDGPLTTSKSMLLSESETTGTSRSSMTKGQGDVALAAPSYDYDIMHNGLDSETGQQFLNECSFKNQHRKPETLQLSASFESKPSVISQRDWETHRDVIIKLYSNEQKTLKEIMDIMKKQYRFTPSLVSASLNRNTYLT